MTNKERLEANNAKIEEITKTLAKKQVSPTDMLQARVDSNNSCYYLFYYYQGEIIDFINGLDTSNVTDMNNMFQNCTKLISVDVSSFDTRNVTTMQRVFNSCPLLQYLDLSNFDTSNVVNMNAMFSGCKELTNIIGVLNCAKVTGKSYLGEMFYTCQNLINVTLKNIRVNLSLGSGTSWGTKISNQTLINTIKELWDMTGALSKTLILSTTSKENIANIYVKLVDVTEEMRAEDEYIDNKKPCVVCESTDEGAMTLTEYATSKNWAIA